MGAGDQSSAFVDGKITGVQDAIVLVAESGFRGAFASAMMPGPTGMRFPYPFGIWFRGERLLWTDAGGRLETVPSVLRSWRPGPAGQPEPQYFDETSMFFHFKLREPESGASYRSIIDWLCLMQHYGLPTRLLDWTENVLVAIYFAVEDESCWGRPGKLLALNAHRLNAATGLADSPGESARVGLPGDFDTDVRSLLAVTHRADRLRDLLVALRRGAAWAPGLAGRFLDRFERGDPATLRKLAAPWAVLPNWLNRRVVQQAGAFTIGGGKVYDPALVASGARGDVPFPEPLSLEGLSESLAAAGSTAGDEPTGGPFLRVYEVDGAAKAEIKEHLRWLGIHEGTLFPELDHQARHIRDRWLWRGEMVGCPGVERPPSPPRPDRGGPAG